MRLAGERRLLDLELHRLGEPQVGGHDGARLEQHDVAGHELRGRHRDDLAVAHARAP